MTRSLQERFPEYSRRKFSPFRALVNQGKGRGYCFKITGSQTNVTNITIYSPNR